MEDKETTSAEQQTVTAVGRRLRQLRRSRGLTLRSAAKQLNVKFQTISHWENGTMYPPSEKALRRLANFYNVRLEWLTTGAEPMQPELAATAKWPAAAIRQDWGFSVVALPEDWPGPLKDFLARAVQFGIDPSIGHLASLIDQARKLGTDAPLPPELNLAMRIAHGGDPRQDQDLSDRYLVAMDSLFDTLEAWAQKAGHFEKVIDRDNMLSDASEQPTERHYKKAFDKED